MRPSDHPRPRRLRRTAALRGMLRETALAPSQLIHPLFLAEGSRVERPISSMPGHAQRSVDLLDAEVADLARLAVPAVLLFGIPGSKDAIVGPSNWRTRMASNWAATSLRCSAGSALRSALPVSFWLTVERTPNSSGRPFAEITEDELSGETFILS